MPEYVTLAGSRVRISDLPPDIAAAVLAELHPEPEPAGKPPDDETYPDEVIARARKNIGRRIAVDVDAECRRAAQELKDEQARPRPTTAPTRARYDPATMPVVDVLPVGEAGTLERNGEDLQYLAGRWFHRCNQCGEWERLLLIRKGRNPVNVLSPVFRVPRGEPIRHAPDCPHAGQF